MYYNIQTSKFLKYFWIVITASEDHKIKSLQTCLYIDHTCAYSSNFYYNYRVFSVMNVVKTKFRNKMKNYFLMNSLILYIKRKNICNI